jgi:hypothetical protein
MKKGKFAQLALMGLSSGVLLTSQLNAGIAPFYLLAAVSDADADSEDPEDGNMNYHLMTEDELLSQLSPNGIKMYKSLSPDGKGLALYVASAQCNGTNKCSGLNACQTEDHGCAGQGDCKGTGKCSFSDKNLAVKVVSDKLTGKRAKITPGTSGKINHKKE